MTCSRSLRGCSLRHCYQKLSSPARSAASYLTHVSDEGLIRRGEDGWEGDNNITICLSDRLHHSPVSEAALGPAMTD